MDITPTPTPHRIRVPFLHRVQQVLAIVVTTALTLYGLGLVIQSPRWDRTPAYGLLTQIFSADTWGLIHLVIAAGMGVGIMIRRHPIVAVAAHTFAIILLASWDFAFFVRWLTDPAKATTSVNPTNWTLVLFLAVWSMLLMDRRAPE